MEQSWTEIISAVGQVASALIALIGFYFVWTQIKQTNKNLKQSNHTAIYSINTEIYKFFAEHSDLRPYFHEGKLLETDEETRNKVFSLSELLADFFEFILVEEDLLGAEIQQPWRNYIKKIYSKSVAFREFMHINKDQYSDKILGVLAEINITQTGNDITVSRIQTEDEFTQVDGIYQHSFGDHSVPSVTQKAWWSTYPGGILGLKMDNRVIGGISFWPVNWMTFEKLKNGLLKERDITTGDLELEIKHNYYISDLAIIGEYRSKHYSNLLLRNFAETIKVDFKRKHKVNLLAFAYSESGRKILEALGFKKIKDAMETKDNQAIYLLTLGCGKDLEQFRIRLI